MSATAEYSDKKEQYSQETLFAPFVLLCCCTALAISVFVISDHLALAITTWMILLWVFAPVDPGITGIAGCALYWMTGAVNFETAFSGFSRELSWFVFGTIILASAATETGLAPRL